ncbi:DNA repair metallo-beta-lactamase family protein [Wolffia australiana]
MPIEMPDGLPFSVDTWTAKSGRKRHHFLTHAHLDHLQGFVANSSHPVYATPITKRLTMLQFPQVKEELFVEVEVGETVLVRDLEGSFSVTVLDANHCPGAAMFFFEGEFGNILHTGDCRLSSECLKKLPIRYMAMKGSETRLDYLFLDCTFGRCPFFIPSKDSAIQQVISCIWKHPNAPVIHLACDYLGHEEILIQLNRTFGAKIFVDKIKFPQCFMSLSLTAPEILTEDPSSRFQVCEAFPRLGARAKAGIAEARTRVEPGSVFIRPSAMRYAIGEEDDCSGLERDDSGVWRVCFSTHSSREELEWALKLLRPRWVVSTTPVCLAAELDYVKNHCSLEALATGDGPIWRLLGRMAEQAVAAPLTLFGKARAVEEKRGGEEVDVGFSKGFNPGLRRLYRSMNVPVPRPLPSLSELLDGSRRSRSGL